MTCKTCGIYLGANKTATRSRFGHINLMVPVVHTLFCKPTPNTLAMLLDIEIDTIQGIISYNFHIITQSNLDDYETG